MNIRQLSRIVDSERKTLSSKTEFGTLLFLSSEDEPRIQVGNNRMRYVSVNSSGRLEGSSDLLNAAISANGDLNYVMGDHWEDLEAIYHKICERFSRKNGVAVKDASSARQRQLEKSLNVWKERLEKDPTNKKIQKMVSERQKQLDDYLSGSESSKEAKEVQKDLNEEQQTESKVKKVVSQIPTIKNSKDLYDFAEQCGINYKDSRGKAKSSDWIKAEIAKVIWKQEHPNEEMPPQISPMLIKDITAEGKDYVDKHFTKDKWSLQCFKMSTEVRMADNTVKKLRDIKVGDIVLAILDGRIVETPVIGLYKSSKRERVMRVSEGRNKVYATYDHKWLTSEGWKESENLTTVLAIRPSVNQVNFIKGVFIGDGHVDQWGSFKLSQKALNAGFVKYVLENSGVAIANMSYGNSSCKGKKFKIFKGQSKSNKFFYLRECYKEDGKHLVNVKDSLSAEFFAGWYCSDGSLTSPESGPHPGINGNVRLYFNQYSTSEMKDSIEFLREKGFNFQVLSYPQEGKNPLQMLSLDVESSKRFSEWISPYVPKCMQYKLSSGIAKGSKIESEIKSVSVSLKKNMGSDYVGCIQTGVGNFVLEAGFIVSNCKINGQRLILCLNPDGTTNMTSRARSVKTFRYSELDNHVLGLQNLKSPFKGRTILDGEIICDNPNIKLPSGVETTSTLQSTVALMHMNSEDSLKFQKDNGFSLRYKVFDILMLDGEDVQKEPYSTRKDLVYTACTKIKELNPDCSIDILPVIDDYESAWDEFEKYVSEGGEGLILKKKDAPYEQGKRTRNQWKLKGRLTIDAYVTGYVPASEDKSLKDFIGGLVFSTHYHGKEIEIAAVSNLTMYDRKRFTDYDSDGNPVLKKSMLGTCAELCGQNFKEGSLRLGSARIENWRDDKNPEDCVLQDEMIRYDR